MGAAASGLGPPDRLHSLAELISWRAERDGDRTYLDHSRGERGVTFRELHQVVSRWAALLDNLEIRRGEVVGISVSDPVDFSLAFLAIVAAGRTAAPLNSSAPDEELVGALSRLHPTVVVGDGPPPKGAIGGWLELPTGSLERPEAQIQSYRPGPRPSNWDTMADHQSPSLNHPDDRSGGVLLSTSGTTGQPKLIRLSESQLMHTASGIAVHHQLSPKDRGFNPLPLFHINAEVVGLVATLVARATLVLDDRLHRSGFWQLMSDWQVTWINAVPAVIARLVPLDHEERIPSSVRFIRSASAPLPVSTLHRFEDATGIPVIETYGMSEAGSQITANPLTGPRKPGSVGVPLGVELRLVRAAPSASHGEERAATRRLLDGELWAQTAGLTGVGAVQIRGPGVITNYFGAGYEHRFDRDGWLDTGDLGRLDADGYLFLVGRADDVINRGGEKIYPRDVEEVITADPEIAVAAVVARADPVLGQVPVAYLVPKVPITKGDGVRARELVYRAQERCTKSMSKARRPAAFHVVEHLPAGATGKVRRHLVDQSESLYCLQSNS